MYTLQQLRFLVAVVDCGGVGKAAERLHISQPSISAGLKVLEQELGGPIFERAAATNRQLRLTPAGRRFYRDAVDILRQCEAAHGAFLGVAEEVRRVRGGLLDTLPPDTAIALLHAFEAHDAQINLDLWEGSADRVAGWLVQERVDVIWTNVHDITPNTRVLWREPLLAVVSPRHPFAEAGGRITVRDLGTLPFLHRTRCELDAAGRAQLRAAAVKLNVCARAEREELAFQLVRTGRFITLAPQSLIPKDLVALTVSGLNIERTIGLQWHERIDPTLLGLVLDAAQDACKNLIKKPKAGKKN
ncbi:MAG TPA: LysR family transcriptional regulator [Gallionella sp.]|nr:LysR family transcriptional regulator [Gallionella sp.]